MRGAVFAALLALVAISLAGCSADTGVDPTIVDGKYRIAMNLDNTFEPIHAHIPVGGTIEWMDNGGMHDVTEDSTPPAWSSGGANHTAMQQGDTFTHTFAEAGTFHYHCSMHAAMGMGGTITVG